MSTPYALGPMPTASRMTTIDERLVAAPLEVVFVLAVEVERWPALLPHYRFVRMLERRSDGGGLVEMSANRDFGPFPWPTWWTSMMSVSRPEHARSPSIRFRHVRGITTGMEVEWSFASSHAGTHVRIVHAWNGPPWPMIGDVAARVVIGPVFVHGIAKRTLAGLAHAAERTMTHDSSTEVASG